MPHHLILDIDDPRLAPYRQLKHTNDTRRHGLLITEGEKLTERLLASGLRAHSLLVGQRWQNRYAHLPNDVPVWVVPDEMIEQIVGFNFHRGVLACGYRLPPRSTADLLCGISNEADQAQQRPITLVVCPDVQDPENLGTILRLSSGLGVAGMLLGKKTADPWSRRVLRVSMGASLRLPIACADDMLGAIAQLQAAGFSCLAAVLDADAAPLATIRRPTRLAIFFGSEGHGLSPEIVAACDRKATIPMAPEVDSLNVNTAAAIFLYELNVGSASRAEP